jgi:hypothetical protein
MVLNGLEGADWSPKLDSHRNVRDRHIESLLRVAETLHRTQA